MALFERDDLANENDLADRREAARSVPVYLARRPIVEAILIAYGIIAAVSFVIFLAIRFLSISS